MKVGDKVFVSKALNSTWTGNGEVIENFGDGYINVKMVDGKLKGRSGGFPENKLVLIEPSKIEGGAPHGFGIWVDGKYRPVDIGALGTLIADLQSWKDSAIKSMPDMQAIGEALELPVGTEVSKVLLQKIRELKTEANEARWGVNCVCKWQSGKVVSVCGAHAEVVRKETDKLAEKYRKLTGGV